MRAAAANAGVAIDDNKLMDPDVGYVGFTNHDTREIGVTTSVN